MIINVNKEYSKALKKHINVKIGDDDPSTYQEFFFYYVLYAYAGNSEYIDMDKEIELRKGSLIEITWDKMKASKTHKKEFTKPWDELFN